MRGTGNAWTPSRRGVLKAAAAVSTGVALPGVMRVGPALAAYPDRAVKIVVANSPGGPSDIIARLLAAALQQATGGAFVVENKGGAGGNIGMGSVARAEADGYTLLLTTSSYVVNPVLYANPTYDPIKDFVAVAELVTTPNVLAVKSEVGAKTLKELVALARSNPGGFNISSPPVGTTAYLAAELLKARENLSGAATVVFTGGGDALRALLSGNVQLSVGALAPAHPHLKSGSIKALATTGAARWADLPHVPTMAEAGYNDFALETFLGLMAPAKTPPEIVARLERETLAVLNSADIRAKLLQSGFQPEARDGKAHSVRISREIEMYRTIIDRAAIKKL